MEEITRYKSYEEYKKELDGELQKTAEGFVRIGYLLKVARDTNVLAESGYKSVAEFAEAEYNLDKTQVSRFIAINDRYSEGGYSDHLLPEWQGYGYAKLTIMMQIPESIAVELSPSYSKTEIQAIKEEVDEEKKVSDLEIMMERKETSLEDLNMVEKILYLIMKDDWRLYGKFWDAYRRWGIDDRTIRPIMAPSGEKVYSVRIPGTGRVMMIMDDQKDEIQIVNTRSEEKESCTWMDLVDAVSGMVDFDEAETAAEGWSFLYIAPWPGEEKKTEVAPVQQSQKPELKKEPKKKSKVQKAQKPEKPKKPSTEQAPAAAVEEEQLPGQMSVEDYPELIPETSYEEVKEEDERSDESGMPGGAGDEADHGESIGMEENAGGEAEGFPEGDGAPEGGGCERNLAALTNAELEKYLEDTKEEMVDALNYLERHFPRHYPQYATMEQLEDMHTLAIKLAAGFEKLMMWKTEWNRRPEDAPDAEENDEE